MCEQRGRQCEQRAALFVSVESDPHTRMNKGGTSARLARAAYRCSTTTVSRSSTIVVEKERDVGGETKIMRTVAGGEESEFEVTV